MHKHNLGINDRIHLYNIVSPEYVMHMERLATENKNTGELMLNENFEKSVSQNFSDSGLLYRLKFFYFF